MSSTERATTWSLTINNPTAADLEEIDLARQKGWKVVGQLEAGENGTEHYQLCLTTPQVRFSAVKKAFTRAHIEVCRNRAALEKYVQKEDTRIAALPGSDKYPSLSKLWELFFDYLLLEDEVGGDNIDQYLHGIAVNPFWHDLRKNPLGLFDVYIERLIADGYHVETMAVNPQVRACWKMYWNSILVRCARQREQILVDNIHNPDA